MEGILATVSTFSCTAVLSYVLYPAIVAAYSHESVRSGPPRVLRVSENKERPLLSLVVPAYNEQNRLPAMMNAAVLYLSQKDCPALANLKLASKSSSSVVEWIVVDDGSTDATEQVLVEYVNKLSVTNMNWLILSLSKNCGKGAAVQAGMLASRGQFALMVDADGATEFGPGLEALSIRLRQTNARIIFGSRAEVMTANRSFLRNLLMHVFHFFVVVLVGTVSIRDTQCGFKLFRADAIPILFENLHLRRWAFDTEIVYCAKRLRLRIEEVMVPWREVEGSKLATNTLNLALVAIGMLRDMVCVRVCYTFGLWKLPEKR